MANLSFARPTDPMLQILTGAVFAESSTAGVGGENSEEKEAIAYAILHMAHFALVKPPGSKRGYNTSFGDGTVLAAIKSAIVAYEGSRWNLVMSATSLKPDSALERLQPGDLEHLRLVCQVIERIGPAPVLPHPLVSLENRIPVQFNQASNSPPSPRQEKIGKLARHTFYAFKIGREAE